MVAGPDRRTRFLAWLPLLWSALLALLLLGPALGPGYVLVYDMVWVPDLALRADFLGVGSALPRAVPSDAVIAVVDEVVPGVLLQKAVLLGALVSAGVGAARLGPSAAGPGALAGRLTAASFAVWSPFAVERLLLGHWPVLLCYAALPWAVLTARRSRSHGQVGAALLLLLLVGSLSANAGLMTGLLVLVLAVDRRQPAHAARVVTAVLAVNVPWVVTGVLHASAATASASAAGVFALNGTASLPAPVAALTLGGVWNTEVVLPSRDGTAAWLGVLVLAGLVGLGARPLCGAWARRDFVAVVGCWAVGLSLAVLTWAAPDLVAWLTGAVPGAGLLRDGSRWLALCLPAVAAVVGHGATALCARVLPGFPRVAAAVALVLLPVAVMPDAAWGAGGRLRAVPFPAEYAEARAAVETDRVAGGAGEAVLLPFTSYRAPAWNGGRKVLDPLGRYLPVDFVASDVLVVDGVALPGEDPRAAEVARALELPPSELPAALAQLGIGLVVAEHPGGEVTVTAVEGVVERTVPVSWRWSAGAAWLAFVLVWLTAASASLVAIRRRKVVAGFTTDG